jgi:hypothetical protein
MAAGWQRLSNTAWTFRHFTGVTPTSFRTTLNTFGRFMRHDESSQESYSPTPTVARIVSEDIPNELNSGG